MSHDFLTIVPRDAGEARSVEFHGVPFSVVPAEQGLTNLQPGTYEVGKMLDKVFFLGMTTEKSECSENWGPAQRWYDNSTRVFIGDRVGKITINYSDKTQDIIPIIFGVNCWPYELYSNVIENEDYLVTHEGPYPEPFASDPDADKLLYDSLIMLENDAEKGMKYVFCVQPRPKAIDSIGLIKEDFKDAGFRVTAITGVSGSDQPTEWQAYDERYFLRQEYYPAMDKLARRLYQFRDELPESVGQILPRGYKGPKVKFTGSVFADILTNVYSRNLWDMATDKLDAREGIHTSSRKAPNFGTYCGFGTFKDNVGEYYSQVRARDVARSLMETIEWGENDSVVKAGATALEFAAGKENDGHGAMMLFLYRLYQHRCVDKTWVRNNWDAFVDAAPQDSADGDLLSNTIVYYGLRAFARIASDVGKNAESKCWNDLADDLWSGIIEVYTAQHPRYDTIFVDNTWDRWTYEYKRFAPIFVGADFLTYDMVSSDAQLYEIILNTYKAQKEDFFSYDAGRQMGYGQGFITETAILLDECEDAKGLIEQAAAFCYHHTDHNFIVPEGVISHPSGRFWYRSSDLGNSAQQAEIIKCARLMIGLDDLNPEEYLRIIPRLPLGWESIQVRDYTVVAPTGGKVQRIDLEYIFKRIDNGYELILKADKPIDLVRFRIGPFPWEARQIKVRGEKHVEVKPLSIGRNQFAYFDIKNVKATKLEIVVIR